MVCCYATQLQANETLHHLLELLRKGHMANNNKSKGTYHEKWFCKWLEKIGIKNYRVPLSGALGGEWSGDIHLTSLVGRKLVGEVKYRDKSNFPSPFTVLEGKDIAFYKRRTGKPQTLVIMDGDLFEEIVGEYHDKRITDNTS